MKSQLSPNLVTRSFKTSLIAAAFLGWLITTSVFTGAASAAEGDYNGDGRSDLAVALVDRAKGLTRYYVRLIGGGTKNYTLHRAGDAIVPGDFNGDGITTPAVVFVRQDGSLEWRVMNESRQETTFSYGRNEDTPIVGDFDCDGKDDYGLVRKNDDDRLGWYLKLSSANDVSNHVFGREGDTAYAADVDGDNCDELILLRVDGNSYNWYFKTYGDADFQTVAWGSKNYTPLRPFDLNGDGRDDFIVYKKSGKNFRAYIRFSDTENVIWSMGSAKGTPLIGQFTGTAAGVFARYERTNPSTFVYNTTAARPTVARHGKSNYVLVRPDGTVVQPGQSGAPNGACINKGGFSNGALWKPTSENTGKPVFLLPSNYLNSIDDIQVLSKGGSQIATARNRGYLKNGNRAHFDVTERGSTMKPSAPLTVRFIMKNGTRECRTVADPTRRYE